MKEKKFEMLKNGLVADALSQNLKFVPMKRSVEEMTEKPENGAYVLVHGWEEDCAEKSGGYDTWEILRWFEAGTVVSIGHDPENLGKEEENLLLRILKGNEIKQRIREDGFYWQEDKNGMEPEKWRRTDEGSIDCWCELKKSGKGEIIKEVGKAAHALGAKMQEKRREKEGEDDGEILFEHKFRLSTGDSVTVKTIPSKDWEDGKELPADVGAFEWCWRTKEDAVITTGSLSARFSTPEGGKDWDTVEVAEQVLRYVMKTMMKVKNPDGAYALVR